MHFYRNLQPVKALSFDLDDTLYDNRPVIRRTEQAMLDWLASHHPISRGLTAEDWHRLKMRLVVQEPELKHNVTRWRYVLLQTGLMQLGYSLARASEAAQLGVDHVLVVRNQVDVPHETHQVMQQLAQHFPMVAITNGNVDADKIGVGHYFSTVLSAGNHGRSKPFPDLFQKAIQYLDMAPQHILHVGDHLITDVAGAKHNGMQACWLNDQQRRLHSEPRVRVLPDLEICGLSKLLVLINE